jgi:hypothetical protein
MVLDLGVGSFMELVAPHMSVAHIGGSSTLVVNYLRWIF